MALIIEDGSIVENANSYQTVAQFKDFADLRGVDYSGKTDPDIEVLLIKAMDFIESKRNRFQGYKTDSGQELQWPRYDVYIDENYVDSDSVPSEIKKAQLQLAIEAMTNDLTPNRLPSDEGRVISQKAVGFEETYSDKTEPVRTPCFTRAENLLSATFKRGGIMLMRA